MDRDQAQGLLSFIAGIDTVYAALNNIFLWLARIPGRRREIVASEGKIDQILGTPRQRQARTLLAVGRDGGKQCGEIELPADHATHEAAIDR